MPAGRPRKPDDLKILKGAFRPDRDGPSCTVIADGAPAVPPHLVGEARGFWSQIVPHLVQSGVAKAVDSALLAMMCEWYGRYRKAARHLDKMPLNAEKFMRATLLCTIAWKNFDRIASRFGLTPSDRARLRIPEKPKTTGVMSRKRDTSPFSPDANSLATNRGQ